jgi:acetyl-CoA C-acetyltransferase
MAEAYIVAAARTAGGRREGRLAGWHPVDLAAALLNELLVRSKADPASVDDVLLGCVSQVGEQAANVARNAVLASNLPRSVPGTSIDRQCGSSQQAIHFAAQAVLSGTMDVVIAGGVESMTRVPMLSPSTLAQEKGLGHYMSASMRRRYPGEFSQFVGAEMIAEKYGQHRDALDEYALRSHQLAAQASNAGWFKEEILPLQVRQADGSSSAAMHAADEGIRFDASLAKIQSVKTLRENGRLSAANSSQICDGAAGVMIVSGRGLEMLNVEPLARILHLSVLGDDPVIMLEAPIPATQRALQRSGLRIGDIDLFEVNEAFAPVPLAWLQATGADPSRLNSSGGAIALGHPLGASGARLMTTLVYALRRTHKRYGLQTICEGGGMANVTIIERL